MSSTLSAIGSNFGYYTGHSYENSYLYQCEFLDDNGEASIPNFVNCLGYIPLFSMSNGILRCGFSLAMKDASADAHTAQAVRCFKVLKATQVFRGVIEFCGGGIIFLIPDLLISIPRHLKCARSREHCV